MLLYRCFLPSGGGGRVCGERVELRSGERDVSSGLCPLSQFFLRFQQSRERLRLFPEQTEGGQALPSERDANGGAVISKDFEICAVFG